MTNVKKKQFMPALFGLMLASAAAGCGTLTGATLGGAAGAGIGAATHSNIGRSAAIGAGVGGTAGALYDIYSYSRHNRDRDYDYDD
jgi:hypothetical protein